MKRLLSVGLLVFATSVAAQPAIFFATNWSAAQAAAPTFSPGADSYSGTQSVTLSTATGGCGSYIYWNTVGSPTTGSTHSTSASVAASETLYAKVIGCPGYSDSAVASAAYTITAPSHSFSVVQSIAGGCWGNPQGGNTFDCVLPSGITTGNSVLVACGTSNTAISFSPGTPTGLSTFTDGAVAILTGITGGTTTITATTALYSSTLCAVAEVSGVNASTPVEQKVGATTNFGSGAITTGSVTTTGAATEICGFAWANGGTGTAGGSAGTGHTAWANITHGSYSLLAECSNAYKTAGTYNPPMTVGGGTSNATMAFTLQ